MNMRPDPLPAIGEIKRCSSIEGLLKILVDVAARYGLRATIGSRSAAEAGSPAEPAARPRELVDLVLDTALAGACCAADDPARCRAALRERGAEWHSVPAPDPSCPSDRCPCSEAAAGCRYVVVALAGGGRQQPEFSQLSAIATCAMSRALQLMAPQDETASRARLTERETECLRWAALGKSEWEISRILGISEHTVERHLLNAKSRLGAVNRVQAVAEAIRLGLIA